MDTAHGNKTLSNEEQYRGNCILRDFVGYNFLPMCHLDYNHIMPVWAKFRELRFEDTDEAVRVTFYKLRNSIAYAAMYETPSDFYTELVKAVEWVNQVKK